MYGNRKEKKLTAQDMVMSCEQAKFELETHLDLESRRINIDSAKKRAVLQHMDYENFHQMVLGANLFAIKSKELSNFSEGKLDKREKIFNTETTTFNNVVDLDMRRQEEKKQFNMMIAEQLANSELVAKNFRDFRKNFDKYYKEPLDEMQAQTVYMFLKAQQKQLFANIFSLEFDVQYFIKILRVFAFVFENAILPNSNQEEFDFIVAFLGELTKLKDFAFAVPQFLSKKEQQQLAIFIDDLRHKNDILANNACNSEQLQEIEQFYLKGIKRQAE